MDLRYNDIYLKGVAEGKKEAKAPPSFLSFFYTFLYFI